MTPVKELEKILEVKEPLRFNLSEKVTEWFDHGLQLSVHRTEVE